MAGTSFTFKFTFTDIGTSKMCECPEGRLVCSNQILGPPLHRPAAGDSHKLVSDSQHEPRHDVATRISRVDSTTRMLRPSGRSTPFLLDPAPEALAPPGPAVRGCDERQPLLRNVSGSIPHVRHAFRNNLHMPTLLSAGGGPVSPVGTLSSGVSPARLSERAVQLHPTA